MASATTGPSRDPRGYEPDESDVPGLLNGPGLPGDLREQDAPGDSGERSSPTGLPMPDDDLPSAEELATKARGIALRLLTLAPRTRVQLERALLRKGIPEDTVTAVLDRFQDVDLIDDEQFAHTWVTSRHTARGLSRRALTQELRHRGVDAELVRQAVERIDPEQELRAARALVRRRLPSTAGGDTAHRIRRLARMLARKGYDGGIALRAIREELAEEGQDPCDDFQAPFTCEYDLP